jgi:transcriptional regulator with XRE-family HTH domain
MRAAELLHEARRRAGLSQRALAARAEVAQPAIARIESGASDPRVDTLDRLLAACAAGLTVVPRPGTGIDRTGIRALLALGPTQRLHLAVEEARNLEALTGTTP